MSNNETLGWVAFGLTGGAGKKAPKGKKGSKPKPKARPAKKPAAKK